MSSDAPELAAVVLAALEAADTHVGASRSAEICHQVAALSARLRRSGIGADEAVLVRTSDLDSFVVMLLSAWQVGAQAVLLDDRISDRAFADAVRRTSPSVILRTGRPGAGPLPIEWERRHGTARQSRHVTVQLTSGTTGRASLVGRDPASILAEIECYLGMRYLAEDITELVLGCSFVHTYGLIAGVLSGIVAGKSITVPTLAPSSMVEAMSEAGGNCLLTVPSLVKLLANYRGGELISRLGCLMFAGERMPASLAQRLERLGCASINIFGTTETGLLAESRPAGDPLQVRASGVRPLRVRNGFLEAALPRTPYVDPDPSELAYQDGWFRTGDVCVPVMAASAPVTPLGPEAYFTILGRSDSQVSVAGFRVNLAEVEDAIKALAGCREAVVLLRGKIEAYIELDPGISQSGFSALIESALGQLERPARLRYVDALPRTMSGKVIRDAATLAAAGPRA